MTISRGTRIYSAALIAMGAYNLIGVGKYGEFARLFEGVHHIAVKGVYVFTIFYGICSVYCGARLLRLEEWARKVIVALTSLSVLIGITLNRTVLDNFRELLFSGELAGITGDMAAPVYRYTVVFTALVTLFEISVVYYFTRSDIRKQFKQS
ncbi:MAG: hypothetical protein GF408_02005 [Candidatus Omnitrophica bacterium]|nr:hypothetical protein [Candidatus Omnitrophota bacterium]